MGLPQDFEPGFDPQHLVIASALALAHLLASYQRSVVLYRTSEMLP